MRRLLRGVTEAVKDVLSIFAVSLGLALVAACLVATLWAVSEHNGEIHQIAHLEQQIRADQLQHNHELQVIDADAKQIDAYGAQLEQEIAANHAVTEANQQAICAATPGCTLP